MYGIPTCDNRVALPCHSFCLSFVVLLFLNGFFFSLIYGIFANFFEGVHVGLFSVAHGFFHLRGCAAKPKANVRDQVGFGIDFGFASVILRNHIDYGTKHEHGTAVASGQVWRKFLASAPVGKSFPAEGVCPIRDGVMRSVIAVLHFSVAVEDWLTAKKAHLAPRSVVR